MSRLLKKKAMELDAFEGTVIQISDKGRQILREIEDLKFTIDQSSRILKNDQELAQGLVKKMKMLNDISQQLYQLVFDVENIDMSNSFFNQKPEIVLGPGTVPMAQSETPKAPENEQENEPENNENESENPENNTPDENNNQESDDEEFEPEPEPEQESEPESGTNEESEDKSEQSKPNMEGEEK